MATEKGAGRWLLATSCERGAGKREKVKRPAGLGLRWAAPGGRGIERKGRKRAGFRPSFGFLVFFWILQKRREERDKNQNNF